MKLNLALAVVAVAIGGMALAQSGSTLELGAHPATTLGGVTNGGWHVDAAQGLAPEHTAAAVSPYATQFRPDRDLAESDTTSHGTRVPDPSGLVALSTGIISIFGMRMRARR